MTNIVRPPSLLTKTSSKTLYPESIRPTDLMILKKSLKFFYERNQKSRYTFWVDILSTLFLCKMFDHVQKSKKYRKKITEKTNPFFATEEMRFTQSDTPYGNGTFRHFSSFCSFFLQFVVIFTNKKRTSFLIFCIFHKKWCFLTLLIDTTKTHFSAFSPKYIMFLLVKMVVEKDVTGILTSF